MDQKQKVANKLYCILISSVVVASIVPLVWISKYNCPSADDFSYAISTVKVWNSTHSIVELLKSAIDTSILYWNEWQGLYSSAFLLSLQPAIFGSTYYVYSGIIMLTLIIGSIVGFCFYFLKHLYKRTFLESLTIGMVISFLTIQFMPSCVEGLYWFNGTMNYGFFFCILLLLCCTLIELQSSSSRFKDSLLFVSCIFEVFVLEGGNHVTALMGVVFVISVFVACYKRNKRKTVCNLIIVCVAIACIYMNVSSPGTVIRQNSLNDISERIGVVKTIIASIEEAAYNIGTWLGLKEIVLTVFCLPILFPMITYIRENYRFKFRYPAVVIILSVAWLAIMYCPPFYAMNWPGSGRLINVVWYCFVILWFINIIYILGWLQENILKDVNLKIEILNWKYLSTVVVLSIAMLLCYGKESWGYKAFIELYLGGPQIYAEEFLEREKKILSSKGEDVEVSAYSVKPELIYFDDIVEDKNDWRNQAVSAYYGLKSIKIED